MNGEHVTTVFGEETLSLLPERAVWWGRLRTLLVADLHLGKAASFRAGGAPVPETVTRADLDRLSGLIGGLGAERVVVLGDLAHDGSAWREATMGTLVDWRAGWRGVEVVLVRGNHDQWAMDPPPSLAITCVDPGWRLGAIEMHHDPATAGGGAALCGHVHPGLVLRGARGRGGRGAVRSACFWFTERLGVLPAFGSFTGCATIRPGAGDRVFLVGPGGVVEAGGAPVG